MLPRAPHTKSLRNSRRSGCSTGSGDLSCGGSSAGSWSPVALRPTLASGLPLTPLSLYCLLTQILDNSFGSSVPTLEGFGLHAHSAPAQTALDWDECLGRSTLRSSAQPVCHDAHATRRSASDEQAGSAAWWPSRRTVCVALRLVAAAPHQILLRPSRSSRKHWMLRTCRPARRPNPSTSPTPAAARPVTTAALTNGR